METEVSRRKWMLVVGGLLLSVITGVACDAYGLPRAQAWAAAITVLCAVWWMTEALPIAVTALVPFVMFPLAGIITAKQAAAALGDPIIMLFLGGFILSKAAEATDTHRQVADRVLRVVGTTSNRRIVLAFLLATGFCSMWISNTATALIMLPIGIAVLQRSGDARLGLPLMLSIAYGSSIGGIATPIGTPPNLIFMSVYESRTGQTISFLDWMMIALPISIPLLLIAWGVLTFSLSTGQPVQLESKARWTSPQIRVLAIFSLAAFLWITRTAPYGGWQELTGITTGDDSTVALFCVLLMFITPRGGGERRPLLDWETAAAIPWGLLLVYAGGIGLAGGISSSGLSETIGNSLGAVTQWPLLLLIVCIALAVTFLTEVTSNTATTTLLMPILAAVAIGADLPIAMMMIPAAIAASCAFMLPVATPPNAIVFSSGHVTIPQMAKVGLVINLLGVLVIATVCYLILPRVIPM